MNNTDNNKEIKPWFFNCPDCKQPHAYRGLLFVECVNVFCKNYTPKQEKLVNEFLERKKREKEFETIDLPNYEAKANKDADYDDDEFYSFGIIQLP